MKPFKSLALTALVLASLAGSALAQTPDKSKIEGVTTTEKLRICFGGWCNKTTRI